MTTKSETSNKPTHRVFQVKGEGRSAIWMPFASAWPHADGKGFNIEVPFLGRVVMREIEATGDNGGSQ